MKLINSMKFTYNIIKIFDHILEFCIIWRETPWAVVLGEDIGTSVHNNWFDFNSCIGGDAFRLNVSHQSVHLTFDYFVQMLETDGEIAWERVLGQHFTAHLLHIGPITESQCCKKKKVAELVDGLWKDFFFNLKLEIFAFCILFFKKSLKNKKRHKNRKK